ncbi:putative phage major tail tube protein [Afipia carboxidovorans OM5]|uniref:Putative phage tail tube protein FII n=1 Tax=Afipia carboxidovorans (strain ATCC 49405 / DSM 1227 / KCTC 32145 / OM5) TaxID=504832 RepID=B6JEF9_AFIC5|nr:phage major tail tube protein [Afipia carboxidovorans]ACI92724.1 putative phage major tail tube protein [Afipia carboxidovorans OM5]AEI03524.1 putative phage tail tube protein FII [Afipia carboxidovorans OM4]AEI07101.1 putative phage tail tube protein FII [Afipia carboxidovorans OM5]BEV44676.1 hypothetical protein CRBSH125_08590 [Afipia carboxidovorans]
MLIIHEAGALFVGDDGPDNGKHVNLLTIKLPTLEEKTSTHFAGGAIGEISVGGLGLSPLEATFKLAGYDPQTMSQFGLGAAGSRPYTYYGALRDKQGGRVIELKSIMYGRLTKIEGDEYQRGDLLGHDHAISEILRYQVYYDGKEKYFYDFFNSDWRVDGVSQNADVRNILRIGGGQ